jgi:hypothetical protein
MMSEKTIELAGHFTASQLKDIITALQEQTATSEMPPAQKKYWCPHPECCGHDSPVQNKAEIYRAGVSNGSRSTHSSHLVRELGLGPKDSMTCQQCGWAMKNPELLANADWYTKKSEPPVFLCVHCLHSAKSR